MEEYDFLGVKLRIDVGVNGQLLLQSERRHPWQELPITLYERKLLFCLMAAKGDVVARADIFHYVWGQRPLSQASINQLVSSLRQKLRPFGIESLIVTVPKEGYMLAAKQQTIAQGVTEREKRCRNKLGRGVLENLPPWGIYLVIAMAIAISVFLSSCFINRSSQLPPLSINILGEVSEEEQLWLSQVTTLLLERYPQTAQPMTFWLTPFDSQLLVDCVHQFPAWERQWQFSLNQLAVEEMANVIAEQCHMPGVDNAFQD